MTQPADIASHADWELLRLNHHEIGRQINDLYQRITTSDDPDTTADERTEKEIPVSDPNRDLEAEQEDERRRRLDYETDGDLDGDYDPESDDLDVEES